MAERKIKEREIEREGGRESYRGREGKERQKDRER